MSLRNTRTPGQVARQVWSQWHSCLRPKRRMKCFRATAGGNQREKNRRYLSSAFTTAPNTTHWISPTLSPSLFWPQTVRLFIFTTWPIYKLLPGGWCSRNEVQAFDPAPDHWLKGCHFSFRPPASHGSSSSPSQGDTLFITFTHPSSCDQPILPSHQLSYQGIGFYASTNTSTQKQWR